MTKYRLRSYDTAPPGGYFYEQFGDKPRRFAASPMIEGLAKQVAAYRKGNNLPRASYTESLQDVDAQTCARRGNDPNYCLQYSDAEPTQTPTGELHRCAGCGAKVT